MANSDIDEHEQPLDPAMERVRRKMVRLIAISIAIMLIGLLSVAVAIVYKFNRLPNNRSLSEPQDVAVQLPPGARLQSSHIEANQMMLTLLFDNGDQAVWIYDLVTGNVTDRIAIKAAR